jgi:hypothetical protein
VFEEPAGGFAPLYLQLRKRTIAGWSGKKMNLEPQELLRETL